MKNRLSTRAWSRTVYSNNFRGAVRSPGDELLVIPASALAPLPPEGTVDGMLLASVKDQDLTLTIATNADSAPLDQYTLLLDGEAHGDAQINPPGGAASIELPLVAAARTEGAHTLQCKIYSMVAGATFYSAVIPFVVDLSAAGTPEQLPRPEEFDPRVLAGGLTLDLLSELGDQVTAHLPSYGGSNPMGGMASGDVITPYVGTHPAPTKVVTEADLTTDKVEIAFDKATIVAAGDGTHDFHYTVTDRAGNVSGPSYGQSIQVVVNAGIDDLQPPSVPAYDNDNMIFEAEARAGVAVTIPAHAKIKQGDDVVVTWGAHVQPPARVLTDNTTFDIIVEAPDVFAQSPDTTPFEVIYEVRRNSASLGRSGPATVAANLDTAGGIDPDPETPWNENLKPVTVFGGVDNTANVISVADSAVDGKAVVPWTAIDGTVVFKLNDEITLLWAGTPLAPKRTILQQDLDDAIDIEMVVVAGDIQAGGSGNINVIYSIARPVSGVPDFNTALSPDQTVEVKSATGLPGGSVGLVDQAELPEARTVPGSTPIIYMLNKTEATGGTEARIPHYTNKKAGDKITVSYEATDAIVGGVDIPESHFTTTPAYVVPEEEAATTSSVTLPELNLLAVLKQGNGKVSYSVENDVGSANGPITTVWQDNRTP